MSNQQKMKNDMKPSGAKFYKCALQVNSHLYNQKYRGGEALDEATYNQNILQTCKEENIQVVGLAEHGDVNSTENLRKLLQENGIIVFPGFELCSTEKIHIICLFPPDKKTIWLNQMLGSLQGTAFNQGQTTDKSSLKYLEIAEKVIEAGGITYAAHVHEENGLLVVNDGSGGHPDIWKNEKLVLAVQINKEKVEDLDQKYKKIIQNDDTNYKRIRKVAVIHAKDVEKPETLKNPMASCYIKMDKPSIEGLRQAFLDGESRIRLYSELKEEKHSKILEFKIFSNFFAEGLHIAFNDNLNALIGGRGTGKSTLLEAIRYGLDIPYQSSEAKKRADDILRNNFTNGKILLTVYSSRYNKKFIIERNYGQPQTIKNEDGTLSFLSVKDILPEIKMFGQNEIFEFAEKPVNHVKLIEQFLPELKDNIPNIQKQLKENRLKLVQTIERLEELNQKINRENQLKERLHNLKALGLDKKFEEQNIYNKEEAVIKRSDGEFQEIQSLVEELERKISAVDLHYLSVDALKEYINAQNLASLKPVWEKLISELQRAISIIKTAEKTFVTQSNEVKQQWQKAKEQFEEEFQKLINKLPDSGGRKGSDIAREFSQISRELSSMQGLTIQRDNNQKLYDELLKNRKELITALNSEIDQRYDVIFKKVKSLNKNALAGKMQLEVKKWGNREPLRKFLLEIEGFGEKKIQWLNEQQDNFNIWQFVEDIRELDESDLKDKYQLTPGIVSTIKKLSDKKNWELEEIALTETVTIKLNIGTSENPAYKEITELSSGQKCTAILNLLLLNNSDPLIIDQPEDNLDNAFIAENIVSELRRQKEARQFIFSTHNANIPVFGDAEWIGVMEIENGESVLKDENIGSIDNENLRPKIENILEGGKYAFETRRLKYNY